MGCIDARSGRQRHCHVPRYLCPNPLGQACVWRQLKLESALHRRYIMSTLWGTDSLYHIIRECSHRTMQACRQKHIALLGIRKRDLRKKRHPISPLFETYLAFATTLGESLMSYTARTGLLAPELLAALETANGTAGQNPRVAKKTRKLSLHRILCY